MDHSAKGIKHQEALKADFLSAYESYADEIFRFCVFKVSTTERAEDITQETFTKFWLELRKGSDISNKRAFLYRLARNLIIDWYRKKKETSLDERLENGLEVEGDGASGIVAQAQMREILEVVQDLDEPSREAIMLRYVEGLPPGEIAKITGESANVISVRLNRALEKIRTRMHIHEN